MIGGPYRTNPPFSVSISMKVPWDPMTLVWSSTDTKGGDEESAFFDSDLDFLCCSSTFYFFYFLRKNTALCFVVLFLFCKL